MSNLVNEATAVSRLFSSTVLKELARYGESRALARLLKETRLPEQLGPGTNLSQIFDAAFSLLKRREFRHEYVYKAALTHRILLGRHSLNTATMITEFRVGECKADVVILNGTSTVYEVKSERDSLSRLAKQITSYQTVFEHVNVIAGENHTEAVLDTIPDTVGVLRLSDKFRISTVRDSVRDVSKLSAQAIFDSITLAEAKAILSNLGIEFTDVPNALLYRELANIFSTLCPEAVHSNMLAVLKKKRSLSGLQELVSVLPSSLSSAVLSVKLKKQDQLRLTDAMSAPIDQVISWA